MMIDYFSLIFSSNGAVMNEFEDCLPSSVSNEQINDLLLAPISSDVVRKAVIIF